MNVFYEFHYLLQLLPFVILVCFLFNIIVDSNSALEWTNDLFIAHFTRFISLFSAKAKPRFFESSWLTSFDRNINEWFFWEKLLIVFKLIIIEPSIVKICNFKVSFSFFPFCFGFCVLIDPSLCIILGSLSLNTGTLLNIITFHHFFNSWEVIETNSFVQWFAWYVYFFISLLRIVLVLRRQNIVANIICMPTLHHLILLKLSLNFLSFFLFSLEFHFSFFELSLKSWFHLFTGWSHLIGIHMLLKEKAELFLDMIKGSLLIGHLISLAHCRARIIDEFGFLLFTSSLFINQLLVFSFVLFDNLFFNFLSAINFTSWVD